MPEAYGRDGTKIPYAHLDRLYIGSRWVLPVDGAVEAIPNPATEDIIGRAPVGGLAEADAAIAAARAAFDDGPWPRMSFRERAEAMRRMHRAIARRLPDIQALIIAEAGATVARATGLQSVVPLQHMIYGIELAERIRPETGPIEISPAIRPDDHDALGVVTTIQEPAGVVAGITGYNFPFLLNMSKIVPALLAGCSMILKPSPFTPFNALLFGEISDEIGLPPGVLNIITGGLEVAQRLTSHPDVDLVSFTGSDKVGAMIMAQAAPTLKRTVMELGGKSALIVRQDADPEKAALSAVSMMTANSGQGCALLTRYLVHNSVRSRFVDAARSLLSRWVVGDPADPAVQMGPLIRESQRASVERYVQAAIDGGATLVIGGERPAHLKRGFFYTPTLFDNVDNRSTVAQDEIFGPIGCVTGFDNDDEAVRLANDSRYGLSGGILSADRATAYRMALRIRTGMVSINGGLNGAVSSHAPFGGYKRSGLGREYGPHWLDEYLERKVIAIPAG